MDRNPTVDCGALYELKRIDFADLVRGLGPAALERRIPATPAWRVRDAYAHVVGITADLNAGKLPTPGRGDDWTAVQVDQRRDRDIDEIAAEWGREAPQFEDGLRLFGYGIGSHYVGDLHAHLQDVRHALGLSADRDELTVMVSLDFYLDSFGEQLNAASAGAVEVRAGSERRVVGSGDQVAAVGGEPFELLRACSGRRSERQVRALDWVGALEDVIPLVSRYPLPVQDLCD